MKTRAAVLALLLAGIRPAGAQRLDPPLLGYTAALDAPRSWVRFAVDSTHGDHWVTGAVIGGATTGLLGATLALELCSDADSHTSGGSCFGPTIAGFFILAIPGIVVGAIVGSAFPKHGG